MSSAGGRSLRRRIVQVENSAIEDRKTACELLKKIESAYYNTFNELNPAQAYPRKKGEDVLFVNLADLKKANDNTVLKESVWLEPYLSAILLLNPKCNGGFTNVNLVVLNNEFGYSKDGYLFARQGKTNVSESFFRHSQQKTLNSTQVQQFKDSQHEFVCKGNGYCLYNATNLALSYLTTLDYDKDGRVAIYLHYKGGDHFNLYLPKNQKNESPGKNKLRCINVTNPKNVNYFGDYLDCALHDSEFLDLTYHKDADHPEHNGLVANIKLQAEDEKLTLVSEKTEFLSAIKTRPFFYEWLPIDSISNKAQKIKDIRARVADKKYANHEPFIESFVHGQPFLITLCKLDTTEESPKQNSSLDYFLKDVANSVTDGKPMVLADWKITRDTKVKPLYHLHQYEDPFSQSSDFDAYILECRNEASAEMKANNVNQTLHTIFDSVNTVEPFPSYLKEYNEKHFVDGTLTSNSSSIVYKMQYHYDSGDDAKKLTNPNFRCENPKLVARNEHFGLYKVMAREDDMNSILQDRSVKFIEEKVKSKAPIYITWNYNNSQGGDVEEIVNTVDVTSEIPLAWHCANFYFYIAEHVPTLRSCCLQKKASPITLAAKLLNFEAESAKNNVFLVSCTVDTIGVKDDKLVWLDVGFIHEISRVLYCDRNNTKIPIDQNILPKQYAAHKFKSQQFLKFTEGQEFYTRENLRHLSKCMTFFACLWLSGKEYNVPDSTLDTLLLKAIGAYLEKKPCKQIVNNMGEEFTKVTNWHPYLIALEPVRRDLDHYNGNYEDSDDEDAEHDGYNVDNDSAPSNSESNSDDDDESDTEKPASAGKRAKRSIISSSDDEDNNNDADSKPSVILKVESSSDDSDSEKPTSTAKRVKKRIESSSEDDDDSEELIREIEEQKEKSPRRLKRSKTNPNKKIKYQEALTLKKSAVFVD